MLIFYRLHYCPFNHRGHRTGRFVLLMTLIALVLAQALHSGPATAQEVGFASLGEAGEARLAGPPGTAAPRGLVLVLPDQLGGDPRSRAYVEALNAIGLLALEPQWQDVPPAEQARRTRLLLRALPSVAARLGVTEPGRIGVLGFGAGGHRAIAAGTDLPVVALYPGCGGLLAAFGLPLPPPNAAAARRRLQAVSAGGMPGPAEAAPRPGRPAPGPVLLIHGSADSEEPEGACAALVEALGPAATRHEYFGATYGWDFEPGPWRGIASLLPAPDDGPGRRAARATPEATEDAARRTAAFLGARLLPPHRLAERDAAAGRP